MEKILVFIPVYNCEAQITRVLRQLDSAILPHIHGVLVIDNVSRDDTLEAAKAAASSIPNATVLQNATNLGYGGSVKAGIAHALANGYDYMLVLHGDDQADIHDFAQVLASKSYRDADLTMGARFHPRSRLIGYRSLRIWGNRLLNLACSLCAGRRIYDVGSGLNIYKLASIAKLPYTEFPSDLNFDPHLLCTVLAANMRVNYVPISWREEDQQSNARIFRQGAYIVSRFVGVRLGK